MGVVRGPCSDKLHLVTIINNTQRNIGFMISKHRLSHDAELITPVSYINPNIQVDRAKIKFFPVNHNNAQQFIFLTIINAVRPLIRNFDSFEVIKFKTNNFSSIDPHTQN